MEEDNHNDENIQIEENKIENLPQDNDQNQYENNQQEDDNQEDIIIDTSNKEPKEEINLEGKEEEPTIYIAETKQTQDNKTQYILKGKMCTEPLIRRYSDFFSLRQKIMSRWPGIVVPNLPPKILIGSSSDKTTIRIRKRLLNNFCVDLVKKNYFLDSEEVKLFFEPSNTPQDFQTKVALVPELTYAQIMENYNKYFIPEEDKNRNYPVFTQHDYTEFNSFIAKWMTLIKTTKENMFKYSEERRQSIRNNYKIFRALEEYEKSSLMDYAEGDSSQLVFFNVKNSKLTEKVLSYTHDVQNEYEVIYQWLEDRELHLMALTDALASFSNLLSNQAKLEEEIEALNIKIRNLEIGKRGFFDIIKLKKPEDLLPQCKNELNEKKEKLTCLKKILELLNLRFAKEKIKVLEQMKVEFYETVKKFGNINVNNNIKNSELWEEVN